MFCNEPAREKTIHAGDALIGDVCNDDDVPRVGEAQSQSARGKDQYQLAGSSFRGRQAHTHRPSQFHRAGQRINGTQGTKFREFEKCSMTDLESKS